MHPINSIVAEKIVQGKIDSALRILLDANLGNFKEVCLLSFQWHSIQKNLSIDFDTKLRHESKIAEALLTALESLNF